ncbi:unnamed protein product, partial [Phaeothamnion confervicola]
MTRLRLRPRASSMVGETSPVRKWGKRGRAATVAARPNEDDVARLEAGSITVATTPLELPPAAAAASFEPVQLVDMFYHPDDARAQHDGFFGRLTEEQEAALREMETLAASLDLASIAGFGDDGAPSEPLPLLFLRFLRANDFKPHKAVAHIEENIEWRAAQGLRALLAEAPEEVLGCDPEEVNRYFPHWNLGPDRMGRPVLCKQYGGFKVWELMKLTTVERMVRSHLWEQEKTLAQMRRRTARGGQIVDSFVVVIDVAGMRIGQVTKDFISLMKQVAHVDQRMFPECLGAMFIINTPAPFAYIWAMFTPMLDPRTVAKIRIFARPRDWQPALLELVDAAILPPEYGGTGAPLAERPSASTACMQAEVSGGGTDESERGG